MNTTISKEIYTRAVKCYPGGVNSPVRAFSSMNLEAPIHLAKGKGSKVFDVDGNKYIDFISSWGALILGHANDDVCNAIIESAKNGSSFGLTNSFEVELAELIKERIPSMEIIRMVNSGTEATMSAIRLARGFTNRKKILKFNGCYHGHSDSLLIKAGSGVATLSLPDSLGVLESTAQETLVADYNDTASVQNIFDKFGEDIAAIIVEPIAGNMGLVKPQDGFLKFLREITTQHDSLLIFDEVMTGFRVCYNSAQGLYDVDPDLTTLGKVIGGGLPVGVYGGKKEIMENIAPIGNVYQAGTLSGNPVVMSAGIAALKAMTKDAYAKLSTMTNRIKDGLLTNAKEFDIPCQVPSVTGMVCLFFINEEVTNFKTASKLNRNLFSEYFAYMLQEGILIPPSPFESMFINMSHAEDDIDATILAHRNFLKKIK